MRNGTARASIFVVAPLVSGPLHACIESCIKKYGGHWVVWNNKGFYKLLTLSLTATEGKSWALTIFTCPIVALFVRAACRAGWRGGAARAQAAAGGACGGVGGGSRSGPGWGSSPGGGCTNPTRSGLAVGCLKARSGKKSLVKPAILIHLCADLITVVAYQEKL